MGTFSVKNLKLPLLPLVLGIGAVVCIALSVPQVIHVIEVSKNVAQKRQLLTDIDTGIKNFESLEQELSSLELAHFDLVSRFPPQKEFPLFLELISTLAKKNNIKIIAMEPQKPAVDQTEAYVVIPVFIDAYCGYHDFGRFVNDLEYAKKFIKIKDFRIVGVDSDPKLQQVIMTLHTFCLNKSENAENS